jgi:hypothetical protein
MAVRRTLNEPTCGLLFYPESEASRFLVKDDKHLPDYTVSHLSILYLHIHRYKDLTSQTNIAVDLKVPKPVSCSNTVCP